MTQNDRRCFRCQGAKFMFRVGGGYSAVDMGGEKVSCPLCTGTGRIPLVVNDIKVVDVSTPNEKAIETFTLTDYSENDVKQNLSTHNNENKKRGRPKKI